MLGSYGPFEAMLGLGTRGTAEFGALFRPGIWYVLRLLRLFGVAPIRIFVAAEGPTVVGTTLVLPWPNSGYILGVGVRPTHRRRGLARAMLQRAEEYTAKRGRAWAVLDVEEENHPAVTLYRARGYEPVESAVWLRTEAPGPIAAAPGAPASARVVEKSGRKAVAAWCAAHVPASVNAVVPPNPRRLSHLESLGQFPGSARATWSVDRGGTTVGVLSAAWRGEGMPGMLFVPALDGSATPDEIRRLVQEGVAFLVARGCGAVVMAVPDFLPTALPIVTELGFTRQLSTLTLARRVG
jgi:GNAT superfamily N-acetyltransferase